jgi:hypothetical protein
MIFWEKNEMFPNKQLHYLQRYCLRRYLGIWAVTQGEFLPNIASLK